MEPGWQLLKILLNNPLNGVEFKTDILSPVTQGFCGQLVGDLFSPRWELRHGAATALRSLVRIQGGSGGMSARAGQDQQRLHTDWMEDLALRLICVLALDRCGYNDAMKRNG